MVAKSEKKREEGRERERERESQKNDLPEGTERRLVCTKRYVLSFFFPSLFLFFFHFLLILLSAASFSFFFFFFFFLFSFFLLSFVVRMTVPANAPCARGRSSRTRAKSTSCAPCPRFPKATRCRRSLPRAWCPCATVCARKSATIWSADW